MARKYENRDMTSSNNPVMGVDEVGTVTYSGESGNVRRVLSASTLEGDSVRNAAGEDLGKIEEIMIDIPTGRVAYAVLSFGGFLGLGSKLFAIPWGALSLDEDAHQFVLNVDRAVLESAPGFDKDNWPDMGDPSWGQQVHSYYGYKPFWDTQSSTDFDATDRERRRSTERTFTGGGGL